MTSAAMIAAMPNEVATAGAQAAVAMSFLASCARFVYDEDALDPHFPGGIFAELAEGKTSDELSEICQRAVLGLSCAGVSDSFLTEAFSLTWGAD